MRRNFFLSYMFMWGVGKKKSNLTCPMRCYTVLTGRWLGNRVVDNPMDSYQATWARLNPLLDYRQWCYLLCTFFPKGKVGFTPLYVARRSLAHVRCQKESGSNISRSSQLLCRIAAGTSWTRLIFPPGMKRQYLEAKNDARRKISIFSSSGPSNR